MTINKKTIFIISGISIIFSAVIPPAGDFPCFYNAASLVIHGQSPYSGVGFYNPIWTAVFFIPYLALPLEIASKLHSALSVILYSLIILKLSNGRRGSALFAISGVYIMLTAIHGNMEYLPMLGLLLPAPIGMWFVLTKPQMGIVLAAVMFLEMVDKRGWKYAITLTFPVAILTGISLLMGAWATSPLHQEDANWSLLPYGAFIGVPLGLWAIYKKNRVAALASAAFSVPYLTLLGYVSFVPLAAELVIYLLARSAPDIHNLSMLDVTRHKILAILRPVQEK